MSAQLYLYKRVAGQDLPWMQEIGRPVPSKRIPAALTCEKMRSILTLVTGETGLPVRLLFELALALGTVMRRNEISTLRAKGINFYRHAIVVRQAKCPVPARLGLGTEFASPALSIDPRSNIEWSHHLYEKRLQQALKTQLLEVFICHASAVIRH